MPTIAGLGLWKGRKEGRGETAQNAPTNAIGALRAFHLDRRFARRFGRMLG